MAFSLVQAGATLQKVDTSGTFTTLTLPADITLATHTVPRWAIFDRYVVMVNTPNRPLTIDALAVVRPLSPRPPQTKPILTGQSGGTLSGTYTARQTFLIRDLSGNIIAESDMGTAADAVTISSQYLRAANLSLSPDSQVSASRLYRTTTNGTTYFSWVDLDGNTQTQIQDDLSDASLSSVASPVLGSAPNLAYIAEWRDRLFGASHEDVDDLRWTETGQMWAWPIENVLSVPRIGSDTRGITGLAARKESLLVGRQNLLHQLTGNNSSNFRLVKVTENCGFEGQESVASYLDTVYWLWKDGVYAMGPGGTLECISDGKVRRWFTTDTYFNRARFRYAAAQIIPARNTYRLFLSAAGSSDFDRFVDYDIPSKTWWGPHIIGSLTPTCAFIRPDADDLLVPTVGFSSGRLYSEQSARTDDTATAIDFDVDTKEHDGRTPQIEKVFGDVTVLTEPLSTGRLTVTPSIGDSVPVASAQSLQADLTQSSQSLGRIGTGKVVSLNFREATVGQDVQLNGYELDFFELGRR